MTRVLGNLQTCLRCAIKARLLSKLTICFSTPEKSRLFSNNAHFDIKCVSDRPGAFLNFDETDTCSKPHSKFPVRHLAVLPMDDAGEASTTVYDTFDSLLLTQKLSTFYPLHITCCISNRGVHEKNASCHSAAAGDALTSTC